MTNETRARLQRIARGRGPDATRARRLLAQDVARRLRSTIHAI